MTKAAIAAVGIGILLAFAPPAHASDDAQYIADLQAAGVTLQGSNQPLIDDGHIICQAIQGGTPAGAVAEALANSTQISVDAANVIVGAAVKDLC
ncbi:DUF732 domain-containing protein [Mycobacterium sp. MMS18-G62]